MGSSQRNIVFLNAKTDLTHLNRGRLRQFTLPLSFGDFFVAPAPTLRYAEVLLDSRLSRSNNVAETMSKASFRLASMNLPPLLGCHKICNEPILRRRSATSIYLRSTLLEQHIIWPITSRRAQLMISGAMLITYAALNKEAGLLSMHPQLRQKVYSITSALIHCMARAWQVGE